jgi:hypothetical protein
LVSCECPPACVSSPNGGHQGTSLLGRSDGPNDGFHLSLSSSFFNRLRSSQVGAIAHNKMPIVNPAICNCSTPIRAAISEPHPAIRTMPMSTPTVDRVDCIAFLLPHYVIATVPFRTRGPTISKTTRTASAESRRAIPVAARTPHGLVATNPGVQIRGTATRQIRAQPSPCHGYALKHPALSSPRADNSKPRSRKTPGAFFWHSSHSVASETQPPTMWSAKNIR